MAVSNIPEGLAAQVFQPRDLIGETIAKEQAMVDMQTKAAKTPQYEYDYFEAGDTKDLFVGIKSKFDNQLLNLPSEYFIKGSKQRTALSSKTNNVVNSFNAMDENLKSLGSLASQDEYANSRQLKGIFGLAKVISNSDFNENLDAYVPTIDFKEAYEEAYGKESFEAQLNEGNFIIQGDKLFFDPAYVNTMIPKPGSIYKRADYNDLIEEATIKSWSNTEPKSDGTTESKGGKMLLRKETSVTVARKLFKGVNPDNVLDGNQLAKTDDNGNPIKYQLSPEATTYAFDAGLITNDDAMASTQYTQSYGGMVVDADKASEVLDRFVQFSYAKTNRQESTRVTENKDKKPEGKWGEAKYSVVPIQELVPGEKGKYQPMTIFNALILDEDKNKKGSVELEGSGIELSHPILMKVSAADGEPKKYVSRVFVGKDVNDGEDGNNQIAVEYIYDPEIIKRIEELEKQGDEDAMDKIAALMRKTDKKKAVLTNQNQISPLVAGMKENYGEKINLVEDVMDFVLDVTGNAAIPTDKYNKK